MLARSVKRAAIRDEQDVHPTEIHSSHRPTICRITGRASQVPHASAYGEWPAVRSIHLCRRGSMQSLPNAGGDTGDAQRRVGQAGHQGRPWPHELTVVR